MKSYILFKHFLHSSLIFIVLTTPHLAYSQKDSNFLFRELKDDYYHAIYIADKKSTAYKAIGKYISIDKANYESVIKQLRDSGSMKIRHFNFGFQSEWYSLHQYKNKYYAYLPSEPYVNAYIKISDSTFTLNYFNDGCLPALLQEVKWLGKKKVEIKTNSLYKQDSTIIFHFLTKERDVAVLEFPLREQTSRFLLIVAKKSLRKFPIIINYCSDGRCAEWNFETPDYEKLIRHNGQKL